MRGVYGPPHLLPAPARRAPQENRGENEENFLDDDDSRYEKVIQELLGESIISTDSFLNWFYAENPGQSVHKLGSCSPTRPITKKIQISYKTMNQLSIYYYCDVTVPNLK